MTEIKVRIQYTEEDLQKAYESHFFSYHPVRTRILLIMGVLCFASALLLVIIAQVQNQGQGVSFGLSFLIYGAGMILYYIRKISRMGKNIFKQVPEFGAPFSFYISSGNVHTSTAKGTYAERSWSSFSKALITKDMVLLYLNQINFLMFPSVHFTPSEFEKLEDMVRNKVSNVMEK
jgi:hypothetical protein